MASVEPTPVEGIWNKDPLNEEASQSLLNFQGELKSLCRAESHELVFEKDDPPKGEIKLTVSVDEGRSCSSTMSLENSLSVVDGEGTNVQRAKAQMNHQPIIGTAAPPSMSYEQAKQRKRQDLAGKQADVGIKKTDNSWDGEKSQQPKDVGESDNEQDRKPAAIDTSSPQRNDNPNVTSELLMMTPPKSPPVASLPTKKIPSSAKSQGSHRPPPLISLDLQQQLEVARSTPSNTPTSDKVSSRTEDSSPKYIASPASVPSKKQRLKSPPSPTDNQLENDLSPASPAVKTQQLNALPSPSEQNMPQMKSPPPGLLPDTSSSHARLQGNMPKSSMHRGGLSRQGGSHHLKQSLSRQTGSHHLAHTPVLPVQDAIDSYSKDSFGNTTLSTKTGIPHHPNPAVAVARRRSLDPYQVPDSQLMAMYQNPVPATANGIRQRQPSGPPTAIHVGGPPNAAPRGPRNAIMNRMGLATQRFPVTEAQRQKAAKMNQERRQLKLQQKQQQQQQEQQRMLQMLQAKEALENRFNAEQEEQKSNYTGKRGESEGSNEEFDASAMSLSIGDLEDDSQIAGTRSRLVSKVLQGSRSPSDPRIEADIPSGTQRQRRQSVIQKDMSSLAIADPAAFDGIRAEPGGSLPAAKAMRDKRMNFQSGRSSEVMVTTAALSNRSGMSASAMDDDDAKAAIAGMRRKAPKWSSGRTTFPVGVSQISRLPNDTVALDSPISTHSSLGYNSASQRSILESSTHHSLPKPNNNYNPQLKPHQESESVLSGGNQSASHLDASSVVCPPSREQVRSRHLSTTRRSSHQAQGDTPSVASSRISVANQSSVAANGSRRRRRASTQVLSRGDAISVASSRVTTASQLRVRRQQRPSLQSGAGLRKVPIDGGLAQRGSRHGDIPVPKCKQDPARDHILKSLMLEKEKEQSGVWGDIMGNQENIIFELACKLSMAENQLKVHQQQQPDLNRQMQANATSSRSMFDLDIPTSIGGNAEIDPQILSDILDFEKKMQQARSGAYDETEAIRIAMFESQKDARQETLTRVNSDRELEIALQMSRVEAIEHDKKRLANQLFQDLGESLPDLEKESSAPAAPLEVNDEVAGTMEVALRLSKEEHDHETMKRSRKGPSVQSIEQTNDDVRGPSRNVRSSMQGSVMEYSASTQHGGTNNSSTQLRGINTFGVNTPRTVSQAEMLEEDAGMLIRPSVSGRPAANQSEDEAFNLAMAMSKMNTGTNEVAVSGGDELPALSQQESLAYALELSRRAPGAHGSNIETPTSSSVGASGGHSSPPTRPQLMPPPQPQQPYYPPQYQSYSPHPYLSYPYHGYPPAYPPQALPPPHYYPYPYYPPPYYPPQQQMYPPPHPLQVQYPYSPPPQPFADGRSVGPSATAGVGSWAPASLLHASSPDEDAAMKMALARSRESDSGGVDSGISTTALADDKSLAIALARSRTEQ